MERASAVECLGKLHRYITPGNNHLRRVWNTRFRRRSRVESAAEVMHKIKYLVRNMSLREIAYAHKKSCFTSLRLLAIVADELCRRPVGSQGVMREVFNDSVRARGKFQSEYRFLKQ